MRGLKAKDLEAILDFIYLGEANIHEEDMEGFLVLAKERKLKGIANSENPALDDKLLPVSKLAEEIFTEKNANKHPVKRKNKNQPVQMRIGKTSMTENPSIEDIKIKIDSLMERDMDGSSQFYKCLACGKTRTAKRNIKKTHSNSL